MTASRLRLDQLTTHETGPFCIDAVYRGIDRKVASRLRRRDVGAVYCYEDGALETFRAAKKLGVQCLYDLPIGYWRAARELLTIEKERWPQWASTIRGFCDSPQKLARKDEELDLADRVFVASQFTKKTLQQHPAAVANIHVIPYGFPEVGPARSYPGLGQRKIRLIFVGGLSQRKGIADLFAIADKLKQDVELTVVGRRPSAECPALSQALARWTWIETMPHARVLETMREHDILVFPSLFEGFGLVITEAMSQGTPVITTDRTAGPDLIDHGVNGWLVEAGSTSALEQCLQEILKDPETIGVVGERARQSAIRRPWSVYGEELASQVIHCLANND